MPKKGRKMDLPTTIEREPVAAPAPVVAEVKANPEPQPETDKTVSIQLPVGQFPEGSYCQNSLSIKSLTSLQSTNLKRILLGLQDQNAKLQNGTHVNNVGQAVRFMLENV